MVVCDRGRSWKGIVERLRLACGWEWSFVTEKVCGCVVGARGGRIRREEALSACSHQNIEPSQIQIRGPFLKRD